MFVAGCDGHLHIIELATGKLLRRLELGGPTRQCRRGVGRLGVRRYWQKMADLLLTIGRWGSCCGRFRATARPVSIRTAAAVAADLVVFGARDSRVRAFHPKTGEQLWSFSAHGKVDSSPVLLANGVVFGSDDGRLYVLDRTSGQPRGTYEVGAAIVAGPAVVPGAVVVGTVQGELICFGWD